MENGEIANIMHMFMLCVYRFIAADYQSFKHFSIADSSDKFSSDSEWPAMYYLHHKRKTCFVNVPQVGLIFDVRYSIFDRKSTTATLHLHAIVCTYFSNVSDINYATFR